MLRDTAGGVFDTCRARSPQDPSLAPAVAPVWELTERLQDGQFAAAPPAEGLRMINIQHTAVKMNSQKGLSSSPSCIREDSEWNRNEIHFWSG